MIDIKYKNIFEQQIRRYYISDMESCIRAAKDAQAKTYNPKGDGGQNFTAALLTLSVIDFCAGYFTGKTEYSYKAGKIKPELTTAHDAADFMSKYFTDYHMFADEDFCIKFYQVFRHGLAHTWSPKGSGIGMDMYATTPVVMESGAPVLEMVPFFDHTKKALSRYEIELGEDEALNHNFMKRFDYLQNNGQKEANELKAMLSTS